MGLIKAAAGAIGGELADSWKDYLVADDMGPTTVMTHAVQVRDKRSSNTKGSKNYITNGSKIQVGPNQMMILMDGGKVVDYTAEQGYYEVVYGGQPSLFSGQFKDSLKNTWERFKFGGQPSASQEAVFINLQEIKGIKFGTRNALQYFDNFYNAELFVRCHGTYSIDITDPLKFFYEACPRNAEKVNIEDINEQYFNEFLNALQAAIGQMSVDGIRISALPSKSMELSKYMSNILDEDWKKDRGFEVKSVGIGSISYDDESKNLINMRNRGAMLSDPTIREGYVQGSVAEGINAAGKNPNGATNAFMGMGMAMNGTGGFMSAASASNQAQMQATAAKNTSTGDSWTCACGNKNNGGKFCMNCGKPRPVITKWKCECGQENTGKFCSNCGKPMPANETWTCACGQQNKGKFCSNCGKPRP